VDRAPPAAPGFCKLPGPDRAQWPTVLQLGHCRGRLEHPDLLRAGGACALAFFDALHYDRAFGRQLRHAKNFLLPIPSSRKNGWARTPSRRGHLAMLLGVTLWGDPS